MNAERWSQVGELFDRCVSMDPAERSHWLETACGGDDLLRHEVAQLLAHDLQAERDGFLDHASPTGVVRQGALVDGLASTSRPLAAADLPTPIYPGVGDLDDANRFLPKAALASVQSPRLAEENRSLVQSRLRELPIIYALIFGVMLFLRPLVLGRLPTSIVLPCVIVAAVLGGVGLLLATRPFSLRALRQLEQAMMVALACLLMLYEAQAVQAPPDLGEARIMAERIMKNTILLVSLLMIIDATYVPKSWRRAVVNATLLAILPMTTLGAVMVIAPESVRWVLQTRADGNKQLAVVVLDTVFLLTLAAIASFVTRTISRLRSAVVEARRFGQYRLGARIGSGGMGEVFLAEHELLNRPCAVKLIRPEVVARAGSVERFEREVRINATLSHPNTVEIFDYGRTEDGTYYYVMEYLPGMSFADLVARHGPLPAGRAIYLLRQVALALGEAHEAGLIHRDIKPSNIFAARRGGMDDVAKLLDFGLVRPAPSGTVPLTNSSNEGQILGTPLYMSPEQATGSPQLDARSDIYSLGAVAYFLLTGRPPFNAATPIEAIIAHARDPVIPPSALCSTVPADLDAVVLRALAKDPAGRFPSAASFEETIGQCASAASWDKAKARHWWRTGAPERDAAGQHQTVCRGPGGELS